MKFFFLLFLFVCLKTTKKNTREIRIKRQEEHSIQEMTIHENHLTKTLKCKVEE